MEIYKDSLIDVINYTPVLYMGNWAVCIKDKERKLYIENDIMEDNKFLFFNSEDLAKEYCKMMNDMVENQKSIGIKNDTKKLS